MCKLRKIDIIAITDHNEIKGAIKLKNKLGKHGIRVIIGEEIMTENGEIIGLFLIEKIEPNLSLDDTIKRIKSQKGFVYIPHPYDEHRKKTVLPENLIIKHQTEIDFIEIHNGRNCIKDYTYKQGKIAGKIQAVRVVGSDAHTFFELGRNVIMFEDYSSKDEFKANIQKGSLIIKPCIKYAHIHTKLVKLLKMIARGDIHGILKGMNLRGILKTES